MPRKKSDAAIEDLTAEKERLAFEKKKCEARIEHFAGMILALRESIQLLRGKIAVLKGQKPRPKIPPNKLDQGLFQ